MDLWAVVRGKDKVSIMRKLTIIWHCYVLKSFFHVLRGNTTTMKHPSSRKKIAATDQLLSVVIFIVICIIRAAARLNTACKVDWTTYC